MKHLEKEATAISESKAEVESLWIERKIKWVSQMLGSKGIWMPILDETRFSNHVQAPFIVTGAPEIKGTVLYDEDANCPYVKIFLKETE